MDPSVEKIIFKVWSLNRQNKKIVLCEPIIQKLLEAARLKGITGERIVMEEDGSEIDDDELLKYIKEKPLILLHENEQWQPFNFVSNVLQENQNYSSLNNSRIISNEEDLLFFDLPSHLNSPKDVEISSQTSLPSTLSVTSGMLSTDDSENENSFLSISIKNNFDSFKIPWGKFPQSIIDQCEKGQKLGINLKTIIHLIVDELRNIAYYVPVRVFRNVTSQLVTKYPLTFMCTDTEGKQITIKNHPLITSFIQRNNYLNRPSSSTKISSNNIPLKKKRISKNFEETCVNWKGNLGVDDEETI